MMQYTLILLFSVAFAKIDTASALTCFECSQPKGLGLPCETNVESVPQTTCATGFSCIKYVWTNVGSSVIHRTCTSFTCEQVGQNSTPFNTLETCEVCNTNLCNNAPFTKIPLLLIVLLCILFNFM